MKRAVATPEGVIEVDLTAEEIAEVQAAEAENLAEQPMKTWKADMAKSDADIPRSLEDVIDVLTDEQLAALNPFTKDKYDAKKVKRSEKPS